MDYEAMAAQMQSQMQNTMPERQREIARLLGQGPMRSASVAPAEPLQSPWTPRHLGTTLRAFQPRRP
jgi:hypothetical protein